MNHKPIRVFVVDDSLLFTAKMMSHLSMFDWIETVGYTGRGDAVPGMVNQLHPDLVLMDITMPGASGFEATRMVKSLRSSPMIIMVSLHEDDVYRKLAHDAGADGYVTKSNLGSDLIPEIEKLFRADLLRTEAV